MHDSHSSHSNMLMDNISQHNQDFQQSEIRSKSSISSGSISHNSNLLSRYLLHLKLNIFYSFSNKSVIKIISKKK